MSAAALTLGTIQMMLTYLAIEPNEGDDPSDVLDDALSDYGLDRDSFVTEETCFAIGYHRGLQGRPFGDDQAPNDDGGPVKELMNAIEDGYGYGLEARDIVGLAPPPSLVFAAHKAGDIEIGNLAGWSSGLDLGADGLARLAQALTIGSGKDAVVVPAGTPVDILAATEIDGVDTLIVLYDGAPLRVPNPGDSPRLVAADTRIEPERKTRASKKDGKKVAAKREPRERGSTLKDAIVYVIEGRDGGNGPLQSNGQLANRVMKRAREIGVGDKAGNFVQKADRHVPYYLNCYKPRKKDGGIGRLGVEKPIQWVCDAISARSQYLKLDGDHDERVEQLPEDVVSIVMERNMDAFVEIAPDAPDAVEGEE